MDDGFRWIQNAGVPGIYVTGAQSGGSDGGGYDRAPGGLHVNPSDAEHGPR